MTNRSAAPLRVVVVDDGRDSVLLLKTLLARAGHEVMAADNGQRALEAIGEFLPDVVISDLSLGGAIDGYALAEAVRRNPSITTPQLIALTGYDDEEHRSRAQAAGFGHYLVKPAAMDKLLPLLAEAQNSLAISEE